MRIFQLFILTLFCISLNFKSFSQSEDTAPKFLFGLQGGGNFSKLDPDTISSELEGTFLPAVGLNVRKPFSDKFSMQFGTQFSQRGANDEKGDFKVRNKYIDLQLFGQVWFWDFLSLEGGFQYSILFKQEYVVYESNNANGKERYSINAYHSQPEFIIGTAIRLQKGIELGARYSIPYAGMEYTNIALNLNLVFNYLTIPKKRNKFKNLDDALEQKNYCDILVLQRKNLTELSSDISQLKNLQELVLDGNKLKSLPPEIGDLTNLRKLSVKSNQLDSLPKEIGNLQNLQELYLEWNNLKHLPDEITKLKNLRYFVIGKNQLESLPENLGDLDGLLQLDVSHSGVLLQLPYSIGRMSDLELLIIDRNTLMPIPYHPPNARLKIVVE